MNFKKFYKSIVREKSDKQYSECLRVGILLAMAGGFLDSYTYLCRGKVFANAQTGNMVMLGINFMEGNVQNFIKYLIPIITFAIGVIVSEIIRDKLLNSDNIHWRQVVLAVEISLLILVAFIQNDYVANILISLVCAMQVEAFRKFHGNVYATTMCTGNLRSGTEKIMLYIKQKNRKHLKVALQYYLIIFVFCLGAVIGAISTNSIGKKSILISNIPLIISLIIMGYENSNIVNIKN